MSRIVDNMIAYRIVRMLVTDFPQTDAFRLGIIDAHGNAIKRSSMLNTDQEKNSYTYLHRLVFNMKKLINRLGGEKVPWPDSPSIDYIKHPFTEMFNEMCT